MLATSGRRLALVIVVALVVIGVDQLSKSWALRTLATGDVDVVWTLRFHLAFNSGAAFSVGAGAGWIRWLPPIALVVILIVVTRSGVTSSRLGAVGVGLIIGGAVSNLVDRALRANGLGFFQGRVVDFIDLQWWPVFNIADSAVVVGGLVLVAASYFLAETREDASDDEHTEGSGSSPHGNN